MDIASGKIYKVNLLLIVVLLFSCNEPKGKVIEIAGSDTMAQMMQTMSKEYEKSHNQHIQIQGGGSRTGIAALLNRTVPLAMVSRPLTMKEKQLALERKIKIKEYLIALDGIAVVVHPQNNIDHMTFETLDKVFSGKIDNWRSLNNDNRRILAISRDSNAGTHLVFRDYVLYQKNEQHEYGSQITYAISNQAIIDQVKVNIDAIGYVSMSRLNDEVKPLAIAGPGHSKYYLPEPEHVLSGNYTLSRKLKLMTIHPIDNEIKNFIDFVLSEKGNAIIEKFGFVKPPQE